MAKANFSVIIPTYTGEEHVDKCLDSILNQNGNKNFEVIVVIDGPNNKLKEIVKEAETKFQKQQIDFKIFQFETNQGRFYARLKGAKLATTNQLLFIDDRVTLDKNCISNIIKSKQDFFMPNVLEANQPNALSRLNYLVRLKVYGKKKWGESFEAYSINKANFEKSPKGTTCLWTTKAAFINACQKMERAKKGKSDFKNSSDDTLLLRNIVDAGHEIYRDSKTKVYYHPRTSFSSEVKHLYQRGPKFVDYYLKKGTRFQSMFMGLIGLLIILVLLIIVMGIIVVESALALAVIVIVLISLFLAKDIEDFITCLWLLPSMAVIFGAGVTKGLILKATGRH